jgi:hypothetical protein
MEFNKWFNTNFPEPMEKEGGKSQAENTRNT